jgi:AcrR family transcriptional regulator
MSTTPAKYKLSMSQIKLTELIVTRDVHQMTIAEMCEEVGISTRTYYRWIQDRAFSQYLEQVQEDIMKGFLSETYHRLRTIISGGSDKDALKGIEMVLKSMGKLKDTNETTININGVQSAEALEREVLEMEKELIDAEFTVIEEDDEALLLDDTDDDNDDD